MKMYVMPRLARYLSMGLVLLRRRQLDGEPPRRPRAGQAAGQINNHVLDPSVIPDQRGLCRLFGSSASGSWAPAGLQAWPLWTMSRVTFQRKLSQAALQNELVVGKPRCPYQIVMNNSVNLSDCRQEQ